MALLIDDAGVGNLVGSCIIGAYREETTDFAWAGVPIELFQGPAFANNGYLEGVLRAGIRALKAIHYDGKEPIKICPGFVLTELRKFLAGRNFKFEEAKIEGPFQEKIERYFIHTLHQIGFTDTDHTLPQGILFYKSLQWLRGGNINGQVILERERYAKTGWPNYKIWTTLPYEQAKAAAKKAKEERKRQRHLNY